MNNLNWNYERYRTRDLLLNYLAFSFFPKERMAYINKAIIDYSMISPAEGVSYVNEAIIDQSIIGNKRKPILTLLYYPQLII